MRSLSKRERLEAAVAGEPVDRVPIALWRHWPGDDQRAVDLARATLDFQNTFDFDFVKCMPSSNYCVADWGAETVWTGNQEGTRNWGSSVIEKPGDWMKLPVLDPYSGMLAESCRALELIGQGLEAETPFIQTIFSPLYQASKLAGAQFLTHVRRHPEALKAGLEVIVQSTTRVIEAVRATGLAGIFLALKHASYDWLTEAEYREFGRPYDLQVLEAADGLWFNVLHVHGHHIMFDHVADYPVQAINWHDRETWPSLREALPRFPGALIGGLHQIDTMQLGTPEQVHAEAIEAIEATGGLRLIVGTGCVTWVNTPLGNILSARTAVDV